MAGQLVDLAIEGGQHPTVTLGELEEVGVGHLAVGHRLVRRHPGLGRLECRPVVGPEGVAPTVADLLDVNVLVALCWPSHVHFEPAHRFFENTEHWATTPITELGLVRISSNPSVFGKDAVSTGEARALLGRFVGTRLRRRRLRRRCGRP